MGELMRRYDWSSSPLGSPENWPNSLKTAVRIMLLSRQPIWIGWGPELIYFYNDSYQSIIGGKHPWALGKPTAEVWQEIWHDIGPMLDTALGGVEGTYVEEQLLIMERNGYQEETYYTFSYTPIPDDHGRPSGIICANTDDTQRVVGDRQLKLLSELTARNLDVRTAMEAIERSVAALAANQHDIAFGLLYLGGTDRTQFDLVEQSDDIDVTTSAAVATSLFSANRHNFAEAISTNRIVLASPDNLDLASLPTGAWQNPPTKLALVPMVSAGNTGRPGVLVVGLNPFRLFDEGYANFLQLVAGQISAAISKGQAIQDEEQRWKALAELDRAKTQFFSNVSHEFRTPLTLMLGPLEEVLNGYDQEDDRYQLINLAYRNGQRLLKLVNALLDFSRIEEGRADGIFVPTDIGTLTAELASNFRSATERAGLELRVDCPPLPPAAFVDRDMWEKIVLNLLSNAFKFTLEGSISVSTRQVDDTMVIEVADTGVGIPQEQLPNLFKRFHRVEGSAGRSFEGSGIGLALVQELVSFHGGTLTAASREGEGTTFTVCLPIGFAHLDAAKVRHENAELVPSNRAQGFLSEAMHWLGDAQDMASGIDDDGLEQDGPAAKRARVLLADDNADMRDYVARLLGRWHSVQAVADGQEALDAIRAERPDLVLTDVMMPRLNGFELIAAIRGDERLQDLPVVMLSARAGEEARVDGLAAGADDYLAKPFSARELLARVQSALSMAGLRQRIADTLKASEERFRTMADNAPVMIWTTDPDGVCTFLSRSWYDFTGQTPETGLGYGWLDATHPDDKAGASAIFLKANSRQEPFRLEYRLKGKDGTYRWTIDAAAPWRNSAGEFLGYIGSVIDITDRREAEEAQRDLNSLLERRVEEVVRAREGMEAQLRQAQKMEAIGKLTGGVAHDFNNLLQVISGNLQLLSKDVAGIDKAEQRLRNAVAGVSRGAKLASQLLAFGRRQPLAPKVTNLGRVVRGMDDMLRRAIDEGVEIDTIVAGGLWNTFIDAAQVENALLNLAINARDAMNGHGKLTIETGNASLDDEYAARHTDITAGQYVMLAVTDTGSGMTPEIMEQVFEPFFTTKPEGQGTGLGLSMVYGFVKQSGGHIKIYSELGQGTTVRLYLPRSHAAEDVATPLDRGSAVGGTETVLVVEDDEQVRETAVDLLSELGYRVLKAKDADNALAIVESGLPIDLLFTDVVMPGKLRSPELARRARERLPEIAVLFTSGYTQNAIVHGGRLDEGVELLSKPYTKEEMARKLRQVLADQRGAAVPAAPVPVTSSAPVANKPARLRILLVEDEPLILISTSDTLQSLGHEVIEAVTPAEALSKLVAAVDVLVTDFTLPGMTGLELARLVREKYPDIPVIFASGHSLADEVAAIGGKAGQLQKPYNEETLKEILDRLA